jgi:DNA-binding response OmpR family regulator
MTPSVLAILASTEERFAMQRVAASNGWHLTLAQDLESPTVQLAAHKPGLILYDRDLPGWEWRQAIELLAWRSATSCIILVSSVADDYLWQEVAQLGGYDVLTKPLKPEAVTHTIGLAWTFFRSGLTAKRHTTK